MKNKIIANILAWLLFIAPLSAMALSIPQNGNEVAGTAQERWGSGTAW
jgi:hypothetical protein